jgi:hypothetical protein
MGEHKHYTGVDVHKDALSVEGRVRDGGSGAADWKQLRFGAKVRRHIIRGGVGALEKPGMLTGGKV